MLLFETEYIPNRLDTLRKKSVENEGITVTVEEKSDRRYFIKACEATTGRRILNEVRQNVLLREMYLAEHSPIREREFWIQIENCPTFVANHFARHHEGVNQYHLSHRSDRCGVKDEESNRMTPTTFCMSANAQALINIAKVRLCSQASKETRKVMEMIVEAMRDVDSALAGCLVPKCYYSGICRELKCCGKAKLYRQWLVEKVD